MDEAETGAGVGGGRERLRGRFDNHQQQGTHWQRNPPYVPIRPYIHIHKSRLAKLVSGDYLSSPIHLTLQQPPSPSASPSSLFLSIHRKVYIHADVPVFRVSDRLSPTRLQSISLSHSLCRYTCVRTLGGCSPLQSSAVATEIDIAIKIPALSRKNFFRNGIFGRFNSQMALRQMAQSGFLKIERERKKTTFLYDSELNWAIWRRERRRLIGLNSYLSNKKGRYFILNRMLLAQTSSLRIEHACARNAPVQRRSKAESCGWRRRPGYRDSRSVVIFRLLVLIYCSRWRSSLKNVPSKRVPMFRSMWNGSNSMKENRTQNLFFFFGRLLFSLIDDHRMAKTTTTWNIWRADRIIRIAIAYVVVHSQRVLVFLALEWLRRWQRDTLLEKLLIDEGTTSDKEEHRWKKGRSHRERWNGEKEEMIEDDLQIRYSRYADWIETRGPLRTGTKFVIITAIRAC